MKPFYSIDELSEILGESITAIADGLKAIGVEPTYRGKPAHLLQWYEIGPRQKEDGSLLLTNLYPVPSPWDVIVDAASLPEEWRRALDGSSSPLAEHEKPLDARERNTLLVIIAALCDENAINIKLPNATQQVVDLVKKINANISRDTVHKVLQQIPEALKSRSR